MDDPRSTVRVTVMAREGCIDSSVAGTPSSGTVKQYWRERLFELDNETAQAREPFGGILSVLMGKRRLGGHDTIWGTQ